MSEPPYFHFDNLSEADVQALAQRIVPEWIVVQAQTLTDYTLPELKANAAKPVRRQGPR